MFALSLGHRFATYTPKHYNKKHHLIPDIEPILEEIEDEELRNTARSNIVKNIPTLSKKTNKKMPLPAFKYINTCINHAKNSLKTKNKDIIITHADKGNITVVLNKHDYTKKMLEMLNNTEEYKLHETDPFYTLEKTQISIVKDLLKKKYIDLKEKRFLSQQPSNLPRISGYPKIHKPNIPLRPVVSTIGAPSYNISKFCAAILNNLRSENTYNISNTYEFLDKIKPINVQNHHTLFSLDVQSLYTSISSEHAITALKEKWDIIKTHTKIDQTTFFKMIKFCIETSAFVQFEDKIYKQTKGLAMGNPLSAILSEIVLNRLIKKTLNNNCFEILLLVVYVDDIFVISHQDDVEEIFQSFNSTHNDIKFTIEFEENGSIPYLDVEVIRREQKLITKWYRKATNKGRLIDFWSSHPTHIKENCITAFAKKVFEFTDPTLHTDCYQIINETLRKNHYPEKQIRKIIAKATTTNTNIAETNELVKFRSITFCPPTSTYIKKELQTHIPNLKIIEKPNTKLKDVIYTNSKTSIPTHKKRHAIYKVNCLDCDKCYIGQTSKRLEYRLQEHANDCRLRRSRGTGTALSTHSLEEHHSFDFENASILETEGNRKKREIKETLHIQKHNNTVNYRVDSTRIHPIYQ